jgi:hypothetical protein
VTDKSRMFGCYGGECCPITSDNKPCLGSCN